MYFFDTYAIIEIIKENKSYEKFDKEIIITSILNIGELYYYLLRSFDENVADDWKRKLEHSVLLVDVEIIRKAMIFKYKNKDKNFSFIDCVGYMLAKENNLIFLTGDKEFENIENVEFVK